MPISQYDVAPVLEPGQWWARKSPLSLIFVQEFNAEDQAQQYPNVDVWTRGEPPANRWNYSGDYLGPPKEYLLWFKRKMGPPIVDYQTGTVLISPVNQCLFFVAIIKGELWILADWEVTATDFERAYVFQPAPVDPKDMPYTRLQRVLTGGHFEDDDHL